MRLLPLLALLLLAVVVTSPAARAEPALELRLMTYNLNYGNPSPRTSLDAIEQADVDIVLLQEITREWRAALEQRFAKQYPYRVYRITGHGSAGIATLSKHPITDEQLWSPPARTGAWFPAQRLVIDSPLGTLQILNVHLRPCLDGGSWVKGFMTTPPVRRKEIEAHWKKMDYQLPTIVAGDFNEDASGRAIDYLQHHGMTRVATTGPTTWHYVTHTHGKTHDLLKMDIDHVMIDSHFVATDAHVVDAGTSDHRPVIVTIRPK
ncbi:MAG: endonuclease/exonuclease/phosphatase family protein [Deltaproteobacteria bacterium]|nr:endonuclease/exonuclease/phosphatase family protein [Deltaproteobacteria bacterium]MDQ3299162.1 endonuclease/exonuclease/phosphatase family protein [Myxococcota bacterium]